MWTREGSIGKVKCLTRPMGRIVVGTWWADESGGVPGTALLRDVKPALSSNGHDSTGTPTLSTAICRTGARPSPPGFPSAAPQGENPSASIGPHLGLAGPVSPSGPQHPAGAPTGEGLIGTVNYLLTRQRRIVIVSWWGLGGPTSREGCPALPS